MKIRMKCWGVGVRDEVWLDNERNSLSMKLRGCAFLHQATGRLRVGRGRSALDVERPLWGHTGTDWRLIAWEAREEAGAVVQR